MERPYGLGYRLSSAAYISASVPVIGPQSCRSTRPFVMDSSLLQRTQVVRNEACSSRGFVLKFAMMA